MSICRMLGMQKKKSEKGGQEIEEDIEARRITAMELAHPHHDQQRTNTKSHIVQATPPATLPPKHPKTEIKVTEEELF